ncbi:putative extracellular serine-rich protein [Botrytis fragariae]|uniref:Putative extracellular serine-rich protein n=1 Tax=Botrytis fragariae TaxID=1964551 RepID=A0A8H6AJT6_9HELO|nr:putative extracellular serine-rich protein [Botrytis fragariae]KAF5869048.1 putative extracellular serine-rich protein [Botrytis fragariae]
MQKSLISLFALVSSAMAVERSVVVGGSGLTFVPNALTVQVGDTVKFQFFGNHSVAQSTYDSPCIPSDHAPIFSGVISGPDPSSNDPTPTFIMDTHVNGTLWLYCSVSDHCQKGMSMEIIVGNNPDASQTLDEYQVAAAKVAKAIAPDTVEGGTVGPQSGSTSNTDGTSSASASSTGTVTAVSGNTTATTTALSTTFTSKASTVTATKSGESGSASATGTAATVTATGAASKQAVALGFAGIAGGLALMI